MVAWFKVRRRQIYMGYWLLWCLLGVIAFGLNIRFAFRGLALDYIDGFSIVMISSFTTTFFKVRASIVFEK